MLHILDIFGQMCDQRFTALYGKATLCQKRTYCYKVVHVQFGSATSTKRV